VSPKEVKHLAIATLLVLGISFSIALYGNYFAWLGWTWTIAAVFASVLAASFLVHEMAHKVTAQRRGLWAEFRLTKWGAVLTLISVISPLKVISPGVVMISGVARLGELGKSAIAGPCVNVAFCGAFLGLTLVPSPSPSLFALIAFINATIAVFNLIPVGILDGLKIYTWNRKIWALAFAVAVALAVPSYIVGLPYI
jgi:Zn-dependent protease